ncbi:MAG: hypothetical protein NC078_10980 [Ruminococcus sp.]|nr:hypothetical protein [Ruminococcus sp.]
MKCLTALPLIAAVLLSGCSGDDTLPIDPPELTDTEAAAEIPAETLTAGDISFPLDISPADLRTLLGDKGWICGPEDFPDEPAEDYIVFALCLDENTSYFSPNYSVEGTAEQFRFGSGLTGASGTEEIAAVLGEDCIRVNDSEGGHFMEVYINGSEIDYSEYDLSGTFNEVYELVYEDCRSNKMVSEYDSMIIYCFNCSLDGMPDEYGGHIAQYFKGGYE